VNGLGPALGPQNTVGEGPPGLGPVRWGEVPLPGYSLPQQPKRAAGAR
jgi:hypothetical protein